MFVIIRKEIRTFFSSNIGYLAIGLFLTLNNLFLWVFQGELNVFDSGFADLTTFFNLTPWTLLILTPAITMNTFSDEINSGVIELLLIKPISKFKIVFGKFLAAVTVVSIALVPTVLYTITISDLGYPPGNWDFGSTLGAYLGLFFLILAYVSVGIYCSIISNKQITVFLLSAFICFFLFYGFEGLSHLFPKLSLNHFGMKYHFYSLSRGIVDTRDLIYFMSITFFFIMLTVRKIKKYNE